VEDSLVGIRQDGPLGGCVTGSDLDVITTARLLVRPAAEADRERLIRLFGNEDFMVYYPGGALTQDQVFAGIQGERVGVGFRR
jgi:hypothetical protein